MLSYKVDKISETFSLDIRLLEFYLRDIRKSITELNKETNRLKQYLENGGSIDVESKTIVHDDGRETISMGIEDNPWSREALSFALNNRIEHLKKYVDLSLIMSFTYLVTTFDAKYIDVIKTYFESISSTFPAEVTVDKKVMKFAYKSLSRQIQSLKENYDIDIEKTLGRDTIESLIEIRETRNILIHNSGVVNQKYLDNVKNSPFTDGQYRTIDEPYLERSQDLIQWLFNELTHQVRSKVN